MKAQQVHFRVPPFLVFPCLYLISFYSKWLTCFSSAFIFSELPFPLKTRILYEIDTPSSTRRRDTRFFSSSLQRNEHSDVNNSNKESSKCPFSMNFPRYQIQLTRGKEDKDKNRPSKQRKSTKSVFSFSLMSDVSNSLTRNLLMKTTYKIDAENGNFFWMDCEDDSIITNFAENIHSVATFWEVVYEFQQELDAINSSKELKSRKILALPDSSFQTIRGLVEILEWYNDEFSFMHESNCIVTAKIDSGSSIPVLILTAERSRKSQISNGGYQKQYNYNPDKEILYSPSTIQSRIQSWVKRILVDHKICPFTKSIHRSGQGLSDLGVPVGKIYYSTSFSNPTNIPLLMADTWKSILHMMAAGPSGKQGISSILLAAPDFDADFEIWAGPIFCMLEACVSACQGEAQVGVVCFHPEYKTPDGKSWPGFGHMHSVPRLHQWVNEFQESFESGNHEDGQWTEEDASAGGAWQRRTPHATINVLRADQLEMAEGRRQTGSLYSRNIRVLVGEIGLNRLQDDLEKERSMQ